jgi:hypothetical protein
LPVLALAALACGGSEPTPTLFVIPSLTPMPDQTQPEPTLTLEPTPELNETAASLLDAMTYLEDSYYRHSLVGDTATNIQQLLGLAIDDPSWLDDENWHATLQDYVDTLHRVYEEHSAITPPPEYQEAHDTFSSAFADCAEGGDLMIQGINDNLNPDTLNQAMALITSCNEKTMLGNSMMEELNQ